MIAIEVNGKLMMGNPGETVLTILRRNNIDVPTLCYMKNLSPTGACRMCVVEVEGMRNLVTSCSHPITEGMKVKTHSLRVLRARKTIIEMLLSNHPDDCLYCGKSATCELKKQANLMGVRERRFKGEKNHHPIDLSNPSIVRDPEKCILCGRCVRVCEEVQSVSSIDFINRGCHTRVGTAFDSGLNVSTCVNCGQCIMVCPTGALVTHNNLREVMNALNDPEKYVVVQHAPSVSVTLGEEFGFKEGEDVVGAMVTALRLMGFRKIFDTSFSADLTIMEEANELLERVKKGGPFPMFTSCSPGWIKFVEQFYPEFIPNLSTCKSPQQMLGALIKSYWADKEGLDPAKIYSVSIMPCTAKKFEANRLEMGRGNIADVDAVVTTRELAKMIKLYGLDLKTLTPSAADNPFSDRSTAGKLFGATGGVMEAALRTAFFLQTGANLPGMVVKGVRDLKGVKETKVKINGTTLGAAVVSGLNNARTLLEEIKNGRTDLHFVEVMTCPGGCIAGGGQPFGQDMEKVRNRMEGLYKIDRKEKVRTSHENEHLQELYRGFLGKPLGKKSHELLHTTYTNRETTF